ncbi:MAG: glutamate-ammonia-ligase adenylyltransferase [Spirochaetaceae bacterium]
MQSNSSNAGRPAPESLADRHTDIPRDIAARVATHFPEHYFRSFTEQEIGAHLRALASLSAETPVRVIVNEAPQGAEITFVSYDAPGEFAVLAGLLSATGFDITSGDVFTERAVAATGDAAASTGHTAASTGDTAAPRGSEHPGRRRRGGARSWYRRAGSFPTPRRRGSSRFIVDRFLGRLRIPFDEWRGEVTRKAEGFLSQLHEQTERSFDEVKRRITEEVASALDRFPVHRERALYPVEIDFEPGKTTTRMRVSGVDTPFFLYALASALTLHDLSVERVEINTRAQQVEDLFELVDVSGRPVNDERRLNQIRLSVAFTKQFTYFLSVAPDRYQALQRFERLIQDFLTLSERDQLQSMLSSPKVLQDLARLLGASDFLWEDFIRLQHEQLLPLLTRSDRELLSHAPEHVHRALRAVLDACETIEEKRQALNDFKDHEAYLIDLDHILQENLDFFFLSTRLTALAEAVIEAAYRICYEAMESRHGTPRTVAGLPAKAAVLGLGKLGGEALGYASDLEMMFIYSDAGDTDGNEPVRNAEFFAGLASEVASFIRAKREGIFQVDLRLRPYGAAGAQASSLAQFSRYYSTAASSLEKLALVRMRPVAGDREFGGRLERLRDELLYAADSIDVAELKRLRNHQLESKTRPGQLNAKFSPGGLVDLEYSVQILQVTLGRTNPRLRTPRIHVALKELVAAGELEEAEAERLVAAYHFFRKLINGLRMLRGNARDLFMPAPESLEFQHLARRMGYGGSGELGPAGQLRMEFETRTAEVRVFVERELGRDALPGTPLGTVADVILAEEIDHHRTAAILTGGGFSDVERSIGNLRRLAGGEAPENRKRRYLFAELAILAWDVFRRVPDPDMAVNHWEQLAAAMPDPEAHFLDLQQQPQRLEILLTILATSRFLSHTLVRDHQFLGWATAPSVIRGTRSESDMRADLDTIDPNAETHEQWSDELRRFRRREILRIGTRDICLGVELPVITEELSNLARAIVGASLARILRGRPAADPERFAVMAFGKLGGNELNYSSDIDLFAIYEPSTTGDSDLERRAYTDAMTTLNRELTEHTAEGYLYRVDLRLRPFGSSGMLVQPTGTALEYYRSRAADWERQAIIKLGPVAGNRDLAERFIGQAHAAIPQGLDRETVSESIRRLRARKTHALEGSPRVVDVKEGRGGIRDIEFLVQGLQLRHSVPGARFEGNTLLAIASLAERGLLDTETAQTLREDYVFLRKTEHVLQIAADRQVHAFRRGSQDEKMLACRMQQALGDGGDFSCRLEETLKRAHRLYDTLLTRPVRSDR